MACIYLMARYSRHPEMQDVATVLHTMGYTVSSRWIWGKHKLPERETMMTTDKSREMKQRFAQEDMADLQAADICIAFSELPRTPSRGGRHVELGMAIAWKKSIVVVGGSEHVFHALPQITHVSDVEALYTLLQERSDTCCSLYKD